MKSPCLSCHNKDEDKNCDECRDCDLRVAYINHLEYGEGGMVKIKRECNNCGRVMEISGHGKCGGCYNIFMKTPEAEREAALAEAKKRFTTKNYFIFSKITS